MKSPLSSLLLAAGAALALSASALAKTYYVNPSDDPQTGGNDSWDGEAAVWDGTHGPKRTLAAVMVNRADGDVVLAAEGTYASGNTGTYRVKVPAGVTLKASGARDKTTIAGLAGTGTNGTGTDALQCVYLDARAKLIGFTVSGGRGAGFTSSNYGAGVVGADETSSLVIDCTISDCISGRAAGARLVSAVRCSFSGNRVNTSGSHMQDGVAYNCYFGASDSRTRNDVVGSTLFNCYVLYTLQNSTAYNTAYNQNSNGADSGGNTVYHCVCREFSANTAKDEGCIVGTVTLDANKRPAKGSLGVDKGSFALYDDAPSGMNIDFIAPDIANGQRVYGGEVDIGCGEYDPRGDMAAVLLRSAEGFAVTAVGVGVTNSDEAVVLPGGTELACVWTLAEGMTRDFAFKVSVSGTATLGLYAGESATPVRTVTAADGLVTIPQTAAGTTSWRLVCAGEGEATVFPCDRSWYVDANDGNDGYDGTAAVWAGGDSTVGPKKSLKAAVAGRTKGDVIYAAEGEYKDEEDGEYRVKIPAGVRVIASGARVNTILLGRKDTESEGAENGCGPKALRCASLGAGSELVGFTVSGGRSPAWADSSYAGGIWGADGSRVVDCLFTDCVAGRGAAMYMGAAVRCRFSSGNFCKKTGAQLMSVSAYNCYLASSGYPSRYDAYDAKLFNCYVSLGVKNSKVYNSYVYYDYGGNAFEHCFYGRIQSEGSSYGEGCLQTTVQLDENFRPVKGNDGVNRGSLAVYDGAPDGVDVALLLEGDLAGGKRVYGGEIDVGCGEYDPRGELESMLLRAAEGFAVTEVGPNVTNSAVSAVIPGGEALACTWTLSAGRTREIAFNASVSGEAVLALYVGDATEPLRTVTAADGLVTIPQTAAGTTSWRLVCAGEGEATVFPCDLVWYVDADAGDDDWDGTAAVWEGGDSSVGPKKSLASILAERTRGDVVSAAEGTYAEEESNGYRARIPNGVKLIARGDRAKTVIVGRADDAGSYGCGAAALRGVFVGTDAQLVGFTVRNCYGPGFTKEDYVGGVRGEDRLRSMVIDCVISDCAAGRAGGVYSLTAIRCRFSGNRANTTGSDMQSVCAYNCYSSGSLSYGRYDAFDCQLFNCYMTGSIRSCYGYNTYCYYDYSLNHLYHCVWGQKNGSEETEYDGGCINAFSPPLDDNGRPTAESLVVDRGSLDIYAGAEDFNPDCLVTDIAGGQRVYNGKIDIGAGEYDWRGSFGRTLGSRRATVVAAGATVTTNAVAGLDVPDGSSLTVGWTAKPDVACTFCAGVDGEGTLSVRVNDQPVEPVDGVVRFVPTAEENRIDISFAGTGKAVVSSFRSENGFLLMLR